MPYLPHACDIRVSAVSILEESDCVTRRSSCVKTKASFPKKYNDMIVRSDCHIQYETCINKSWWGHKMEKHFPHYWPFVRGISNLSVARRTLLKIVNEILTNNATLWVLILSLLDSNTPFPHYWPFVRGFSNLSVARRTLLKIANEILINNVTLLLILSLFDSNTPSASYFPWPIGTLFQMNCRAREINMNCTKWWNHSSKNMKA